jgi:hypothetical protein
MINNKLEIIVNGNKLKADRFMSYGFDNEYFAFKGRDLYYKSIKGYVLLEKNFVKENLK